MSDRVLNKPLINLFKSNDKNNSGVVRLNQTMSKLLTLGKFFQNDACKLSSCLQIATLCFEHTEHVIINGCKLLKIFERVLMFNSNEPIKVVNFQK